MNRLTQAAAALSLAIAPAQLALATPTETVVMDADLGDPLDIGWGIVVDGNGDLFVAGRYSDNVLMRTPAGVVSEVLTSTGAGGHPLDEPTELAMAADNTLYVIGATSLNVFKRSPAGTWTQILDASGDGAGHTLAYPEGLAVDGSGNVYVSDSIGNQVFRITSAGVVSVILDATGDGAGNTLEGPTDLTTDSAGNLYVVGRMSDNVFRVTPGGVITEMLESTAAVPLDYPRAVLVAADGTLYVSAENTTLVRRDPGGGVTATPTNVYTEGAAFGPSGTVLLASRNETRVIGIRPDGPKCLLIAGYLTPTYTGSFRVTSTPDGVVYASSHTKVYRIDNACGPAPDVSGAWHVTIDNLEGSDPPHYYRTQQWSQSGFDVTIADPSDTFTGTIDDRGYFHAEGTQQNCNTTTCCVALTYSGQVGATGMRWDGYLLGSSPIFIRCGGYGLTAVGTRCGNGVLGAAEECEDENALDGDGCSAECAVEPCYECTSDVPSSCTPAIRTCAGNTSSGGTSLKIDSAPDKPAKLQWKISHGESSTLESLGTPETTTSYSLCIFDRSQPEPSLFYSAGAPAGAGWSSSSKGVSLKLDNDDAPQGFDQIKLQSGATSKVKVRASGINFTPPVLPLPLPLTIQLQASDGGCFESAYSLAGAGTNTEERVRASADAR